MCVCAWDGKRVYYVSCMYFEAKKKNQSINK